MEPILINKYDNMPRQDYPRPAWVRSEWYSLNGEWEFEFDFSVSGEQRAMFLNGEFKNKITVPFCPESKLSGIGYRDFMPCVWYRKHFDIDIPQNSRVLLHFGAVDYESKVWVNGNLCGTHKGGYCAFSYDITDYLKNGENTIVVMAKDDLRSLRQPFGKQSDRLYSYACSYTRTTGIWQTVWLEFVPQTYLSSSKMTPHAKDGTLDISVKGKGRDLENCFVKATAFYKGKEMASNTAHFVGDTASTLLTLSKTHLWEVLNPKLYDLKIELFEGKEKTATDTVYSYFALRDISFNKKGLFVNGKPVFMRLVLDQGFNPDGIYTGPSAEFLEKDIDLAIALGFNGARLHQRVFEERTLYYADKKGYIVWAEAPSGIDLGKKDATELFLPEWTEIINSHYNHPSVIGWCPFNEIYHCKVLNTETITTVYRFTKLLDPYRPCIDASGGTHYETDMFDVHDYEQYPERLKNYLEPMLFDPMAFTSPIARFRGSAPVRKDTYTGQPYWVSEFGGTLWNPDIDKDSDAWGYGDAPKTEEQFISRFEGLVETLLNHPRVCGFCYTQLTDIEQEQNGLYFYNRTEKFSKDIYERMHKALKTLSAIEK